MSYMHDTTSTRSCCDQVKLICVWLNVVDRPERTALQCVHKVEPVVQREMLVLHILRISHLSFPACVQYSTLLARTCEQQPH